jgi:hypothetical protein
MNQTKIIKSNYQRLLLIFCLPILAITSCNKQEKDLCGNESIGDFYLLESSINSIPYSEAMNLHYVDSVGNHVVLELEEAKYRTVNHDYQTICEYDNLEEKHIMATGDEYSYQLKESTNLLNMKIYLNLFVNPFAGETMLSDEISISIGENNDTSVAIGALSILVNKREITEEFINDYSKTVAQVELLNKTFSNVYTNRSQSCYYNYEFGLIAFEDNSRTLWVLDKSERDVK